MMPTQRGGALPCRSSYWTAVLAPVGVEHRALGGDGDVVGERGDDLLVPGVRSEVGEGGGFVGLHRQQRVACVHGGLLLGEAASVERWCRQGRQRSCWTSQA